MVRIIDMSGRTVSSYVYNACGKQISATSSSLSNAANVTAKNPLRYRGHYYDTETKLYYLQSRYYNPEMGRFINADAFTSTGQGLLGNNMYAYCNNNPVIRVDTEGTFFFTILGAAIGAAVGALDAWMMGGDTEEIVNGAKAGAWSGGIAGAGVDVGVLIVASGGSVGVAMGVAAFSGAAGGVVGTGISTEWQADPIDYAGSAVLGAGLNMVSLGTAPLNGQIIKGTIPQMVDSIFYTCGTSNPALLENAVTGTIIAEASVWIYKVITGKASSVEKYEVAYE